MKSFGDAAALNATTPIFTGLVAWLLMRERWSPVDILASTVGLIGALFICRPSFLFGVGAVGTSPLVDSPDGVLAGVMGRVAAALGYVAIRALRGREEFTVVVNYFALFTIGISLVLNGLSGRSFVLPLVADTEAWVQLIAIGGLGYAAHVALTFGMAMAPAGPASAMLFLQVLVAFALQTFALHKPLSPWSVAGAALIAACICTISAMKWYASRRSVDPTSGASGDVTYTKLELGMITDDANSSTTTVNAANAGSTATQGRMCGDGALTAAAGTPPGSGGGGGPLHLRQRATPLSL